MSNVFRAPWGRDVAVMSLIGTFIIATPVVVQALRGVWVVPVMLLTILTIVLVNCVRGYEIHDGELRVRRLLWSTSWPLDATATANVRPYAMRGSWRTWGNGGMYAITGRFSGSGLGRYQAFVTDPARTVVINTARGIVVVSPDRPQQFADAVAAARIGA